MAAGRSGRSEAEPAVTVSYHLRSSWKNSPVLLLLPTPHILTIQALKRQAWDSSGDASPDSSRGHLKDKYLQSSGLEALPSTLPPHW